MTGRLGFSHPKRERLRAWLDAPEVVERSAAGDLGDDEIDRITRHVETCERCASELEDLARTGEIELAPDDELARAPRCGS